MEQRSQYGKGACTNGDLVLRCSTSPMREIDVTFSRTAAAAFADALADGAGTFQAKVGTDPGPYQSFLSGIEVAAQPTGKVVMSLDMAARNLRFAGAVEYLTVLGNNIRNLAEAPDPSGHLHVEYFEDHYYLAESELSVVFQISQWVP